MIFFEKSPLAFDLPLDCMFDRSVGDCLCVSALTLELSSAFDCLFFSGEPIFLGEFSLLLIRSVGLRP